MIFAVAAGTTLCPKLCPNVGNAVVTRPVHKTIASALPIAAGGDETKAVSADAWWFKKGREGHL
jgi:hypothetical protein|tara:strand:- start:152 stop:343 length:192 start_codon:yes stop_codon:yes gene_type:complete